MSRAPRIPTTTLPRSVPPTSNVAAMRGMAPTTEATAPTNMPYSDGLSRSASLRAISTAWPRKPKPRLIDSNMPASGKRVMRRR
jgi:hypothetical protein